MTGRSRGRVSEDYLPFKEARKFARSLKLKNTEEWKAYITGDLPHLPRPPKKIRYDPDVYYEEWIDWYDWLGKKKGKKKDKKVPSRRIMTVSSFSEEELRGKVARGEVNPITGVNE